MIGLVIAALVVSGILASPTARRFVIGAELDGKPRTDAGFGRRGTRALTPTGHASRWHHQRFEVRAAVRLGGVTFGGAVAYGLIMAPALTVLSLELFGGALVAGNGWLGWRAARVHQGGRWWWVHPAHVAAGLVGGVAYRAAAEWQHMRQCVRPLHLALAPVLGVPRATSPKSYLTVPRDYAKRDGCEIVVRLPEGFALTGDMSQRVITDIACAKLALERPSSRWQLAGREPYVTLTVQTPPPDKVPYADVRHLIAAAKDDAPLLGLGRAGNAVHAQLILDSPHLLVSAGSGAGKSVILRALAAQVLNRGGLVLIADVKRLSHTWARGLKGARIVRDAQEIHDALLWLAAELDRRNRKADEGADINGDTDHLDLGPRILLIMEEMNATAGKLAAHWKTIKGKDEGGSPALAALAEISYMGRQVRCNMAVCGQMVTARALGSPEARESLGIRVLARATMNTARMLVPEIWPFPKTSRRPGRVQVCVGGEATETQVVYMTATEARELATSGRIAEFPPINDAERASAAWSDGKPTPAPEPVGLREAVASGLLPISLEAARSARARDPEFPRELDHGGPGGEHRYDPRELAAWASSRPRAGVA
jgi:hypothetical protein